jgi:hypothetical protein
MIIIIIVIIILIIIINNNNNIIIIIIINNNNNNNYNNKCINCCFTLIKRNTMVELNALFKTVNLPEQSANVPFH